MTKYLDEIANARANVRQTVSSCFLFVNQFILLGLKHKYSTHTL